MLTRPRQKGTCGERRIEDDESPLFSLCLSLSNVNVVTVVAVVLDHVDGAVDGDVRQFGEKVLALVGSGR